MVKRYNAIDVICWKAKSLGTTYGELCAKMVPGDLERFEKEFLEYKAAEKELLRKEAESRQAQRAKNH